MSKKITLFILIIILMPTCLFTQVDLDNLDRSLKEYKSIVALAPDCFAAFNNMGNIFFMKEELESAEISYFKAEAILNSKVEHFKLINRDSTQKYQNHLMGVILNLGTLYVSIDDTLSAYEMYSRVIDDSLDVAKAKALLGLPPDQEPLKRSKKKSASSDKVSKMLSKTSNEKSKKTKSPEKSLKSGKKESKKKVKESKNKVRKGTKSKIKIDDVFYWINEY